MKNTSHDQMSIVMLTYNDASKTKDCIQSLLPVISHDLILEFIILDNNSSDETRDYVASLSCMKKVKVILSDENKGVALGRKQLFSLARGNIIISLDSDIIVTDINFFYRAYNLLKMNIHVGICGISGYFVDFKNGCLNLQQSLKEGYVHCVSGCCQIFWKYLLDSVSIDETFSPFWCEDTDFCFQIIQQNKLVYYIPSDYGLRHDYRSKETRKNDAQKTYKEQYLVQKWKHKIHFDNINIHFINPVPPSLWVLKLEPSDVEIGFNAEWYPEHVIVTQNNLYHYLPEIKNDPSMDPIYIQLLLLFKYGGVCISWEYVHFVNIFKALFFNMLSGDNLDIILLQDVNGIQDDIIAAKKGSTFLHKAIVFKKLKSLMELKALAKDKCKVIDNWIGTAGTDSDLSWKLTKRNSIKISNNDKITIPSYSHDSQKLFLFSMPKYHMNPCVKRSGDHYYVIVRHESNPESPLTSHTKNILYYMDQDFNVSYKKELHLTIGQHCFIERNRIGLSETEFIVEDLRFIENTDFVNNKILVCGSAMIDYENNYLTKIALFELDVMNYSLTFVQFLDFPKGKKVEKNCLIYYQNPHYYVVYSIDPLRIYQCSSDFKQIRLHHEYDHQIVSRYICGNYEIVDKYLHLCSMVEFNKSHYLILFRLFEYNQHYTKQKKRIYYNFAILINKKNYCIDYIYDKDLFSNYAYNIIITNSLMVKEEAIYFFCGFNDELSGYIRFDMNFFLNKLLPY